MNAEEFIQNFLEHAYDPVKAHEYYLKVRKLHGAAGVAKDTKANAYQTKVVGDAQQKLNADLKNTKVQMNPKRRIGAAEQKLIRAKSLASRVKDPTVKADMLAKISATEKKLQALKQKHGVTNTADPTPVKTANAAPAAKGAPKRQTVTYSDGSTVTYEGDKEVGTTPPTKKKSGK